jgi:hypothetical protein
VYWRTVLYLGYYAFLTEKGPLISQRADLIVRSNLNFTLANKRLKEGGFKVTTSIL